jgi:hypothetical protein
LDWVEKICDKINSNFVTSTFKKFVKNHDPHDAITELNELAEQWPTQYQELMAWAVNAESYPNVYQQLTVLKRIIENTVTEPDETEPVAQAAEIAKANPEAFSRAVDWANKAVRSPSAHQFLVALTKIRRTVQRELLSIFDIHPKSDHNLGVRESFLSPV